MSEKKITVSLFPYVEGDGHEFRFSVADGGVSLDVNAFDITNWPDIREAINRAIEYALIQEEGET